ncbi:hypothetical protein [Rhizobium lentis]|uniref:hypothetical protein n=1 Tax=Rhizobium lentis TaxID=1138194 RepID=UPI0038FBFB05
MHNMIKTGFTSSFLAVAVLAAFIPASAQSASSVMAYPDKCRSEMSSGGDMSMQGQQMSGTAEFKKETMDGMKAMNMMQGMMK